MKERVKLGCHDREVMALGVRDDCLQGIHSLNGERQRGGGRGRMREVGEKEHSQFILRKQATAYLTYPLYSTWEESP